MFLTCATYCNITSLPVFSSVATMKKREREPYLFSAGGIGSGRFLFSFLVFFIYFLFFFLLLLWLLWLSRLFQLFWPCPQGVQVSFSIYCTLVTHQEVLRLACTLNFKQNWSFDVRKPNSLPLEKSKAKLLASALLSVKPKAVSIPVPRGA